MDTVLVFISYSSADTEFATRLKNDLRASGADVWIDHESLPPGEPNWQDAIRRGLEAATAVIYVGSPDAAGSLYVGSEVALARVRARTIYPLWARGEHWAESAPLELIPAQHIDARGSAYTAGLTKLCQHLGLPAPRTAPEQVFADPTGSLRVVELLTIEAGRSVHSLAWAPDGSHFASADQSIYLWDAISGRCVATLSGHIGGVRSVAWAPDGARIASGGDDQTIRIWDHATKRSRAILTGHTDGVRCVSWAPDGVRLASGGDDGAVCLWDSDAGRLLTKRRKPLSRLTAALPGDSELTKGLERVIQVFSDDMDEQSSVYSVAWSPDSSCLAFVSDDSAIWRWDLTSGRLLPGLKKPLAQAFDMFGVQANSLYSVAWAPDGARLAAAGESRTVDIWDQEAWHLFATLPSHTGAINSVVWRPDGLLLASASDDHSIRLWDPHSGRLLVILTGHTGAVECVAWASDGSRLASGDANGIIRIWDIVS